MLPVRCAMHTALCELQWRCAEWADLDAPQCLDSLSPKWGPAPRYTVHNFAFDPLHRTSAFQPLYTTQQSRGNSRARPQTFSPPSSVASCVFKEEEKCFWKIQFCLSNLSFSFSRFQFIILHKDFYQSPQLFLLFCSSQQMTQQMNPVHSGADSSCLLYTFPPHLHQIWKVALDKYKIYSRKIALSGFSNYVQGHMFNPQSKVWWIWFKRAKFKQNLSCKIYLIVGAAWICGAAGLERVPCEFADENQCWVISKTNIISNIISKTNISCALPRDAAGGREEIQPRNNFAAKLAPAANGRPASGLSQSGLNVPTNS